MMQISPEQGAFMTMLTQLLDVRQAVEVGTFTGYSRAVHRPRPRPTAATCSAAT